LAASKPSRREFFLKAAQGTALAASGGLVWLFLLQHQARATPFAIRPPGAHSEAEFNALCIKCGLCVPACPYGTLKLAAAGDKVPIGTPYFLPREVPCYMCPDIPCKVACPTGALDPSLTDVNQARMGLAVIDIESCLSWQGLRCEICHRECPVTNKAITIANHPRKTSKHALFVPLVHSDHCTGCGVCEKVCPTDVPAIRVVQADIVQGKMGAHYRLGWTDESSITQEFVPAKEAPATGPGTNTTEAGLDYLNE
jgi:ferredoxin-type protein NapG